MLAKSRMNRRFVVVLWIGILGVARGLGEEAVPSKEHADEPRYTFRNPEDKASEERTVQRHKDLFAANSATFSTAETEAVQAYIRVEEVWAGGIAGQEEIDALDALYVLAGKLETSSGKPDVLWRLFQFSYGAVPLWIARAAGRAKSLPVEKRVEIVRAQLERSSDYRIKEMLWDLLTEKGDYDEAIDICKKGIEAGDRYRWVDDLAYMRIKYQRHLISEALKKKGITKFLPNEAGIPFQQWDLVLTEARGQVEASNDMALMIELAGIIGTSAISVGTCESALEFQEFCLGKLTAMGYGEETPEVQHIREYTESLKKEVAIGCELAL